MKAILKPSAIAVGVALATSGVANAVSFGEVWVGDQQDGKLYIFDQSELNNAGFDAQEDTIQLSTAGGTNSTRMHLIGFTNHTGLDPASHAILSYLQGQAEVWRTNGGTHAPTLEAVLDVSVVGQGANAKSSLHECANDASNTRMGCSSIGNKEVVFFDTDFSTGTYTRLGGFPLTGLTIHPNVGGKTLTAINTAIANGVLNGSPICGNYSTNGKLYYVVVSGGSPQGGSVLVLDTKNPSNPTLRDAFETTGVGCELLNDADGKHMWSSAGSKNDADDEKVYLWKFRHAKKNKKTGPKRTVDIPEIDKGDIHGGQFAGLGGLFLWETMRLDDIIYIINPSKRNPRIVNSFSYEFGTNTNPGGDVLDRSAFGTRMYLSLRGAIPTTAITGINDPNRRPGVMVMSSHIFGGSGSVLKIEDIQSGNLVDICPSADEGDPDHDHGNFEVCDNTHIHYSEHISVDSADPHGLKSLSYLSGGF